MIIQPAPYSKDYDIADAMFAAFQTPGGMPFFWKLFGWGTVVFSIVCILTVVPILSSYADLIRATAISETDPDAFAQIFGSLGQFFLMLMLFTVGYSIIVATIRAAFFRGYFMGDFGGTLPLRFGSQEVRQTLAYLGFYTLLTIGVIVVAIIMIIPSVFILTPSGGESFLALTVGMIIFYSGFLAFSIWFGVRFSTAGALTAWRGKTHVLASRHVSRNRFWPLFGAILVAGLIGCVVSNVTSSTAIVMAFSELAGTELFALMSGTDPDASVQAVDRAAETASLNLKSILAIILMSAGLSFYVLILSGPQAFFTRQWAQAGGDLTVSVDT